MNGLDGVKAIMSTAENAVDLCRRQQAEIRRLRADNEKLRHVASAAQWLCIKLDNVPLGMNPGERGAVVDCVAARLTLVEKLDGLSR